VIIKGRWIERMREEVASEIIEGRRQREKIIGLKE
jgi:hypothetical protein